VQLVEAIIGPADSILIYLAHAFERVCKEVLYRDGLRYAISSRKILLKLVPSNPEGANERWGLSLAILGGILEVRQRLDAPLGHGRAQVHDMLNDVAGKLRLPPAHFVPPAQPEEVRLPVPPFTLQSARQKVQLAEDAWNSKDPARVSLAYTSDTEWRNRSEFINGREVPRVASRLLMP
jgi:hypothetical protein